MEDLRIVIQVFDHRTMQYPKGSARLVLTPTQQALIQRTSDPKDLAQWASTELSSIISCLEDLETNDPNR